VVAEWASKRYFHFFICLEVMKVLPCRKCWYKTFNILCLSIFRLLNGRSLMWHFMFLLVPPPPSCCYFSLWRSTGWVSVQVRLNTETLGTGGWSDALLTTSFDEHTVLGRRRIVSVLASTTCLDFWTRCSYSDLRYFERCDILLTLSMYCGMWRRVLW
jgi:hypothetical protein